MKGQYDQGSRDEVTARHWSSARTMEDYNDTLVDGWLSAAVVLLLLNWASCWFYSLLFVFSCDCCTLQRNQVKRTTLSCLIYQ